MGVLNELNDTTKGIIHIMVTQLCDRNCRYCCNNQYDLNIIPYVNGEELKNAHTICLTGGEPFAYSQPVEIARYFKQKYPNIQKVYVYTNAYELDLWMQKQVNIDLSNIDGLSISIKNTKDLFAFESALRENREVLKLKSNHLYVLNNLLNEESCNGFNIIKREWQQEFVPAKDSIFRRI